MKTLNVIKGMDKKWKIAILAGILLGAILGTYFTSTKNYEANSDVGYSMFTFDKKTGRTIPVGPNADKWIPVEEYEDNSVQVNWEKAIVMNDGDIYYEGTVDGEYRKASKGYWNSVLLARQPEVFFGYVYIGDDA